MPSSPPVEPIPRPRLVVIGSSAGGIEALSTLVATLPADFPAPIVVAQHLDPHRPSHLQQILAERSTLPVRTLPEHEPQPLEPGIVLLVPSNRHVRVSAQEIGLQVDSHGRPKPSIDLLFRTAAEVYGEGLIAVILTGMGSDGAAGARIVKEAGGTVLIQNPATASFPDMPLSLAPTTVDFVADLPSIGGLLNRLLIDAAVPMPEEDQLRPFLDALRSESGIDFGNYKQPTIWRRLQHRIAATGTGTLDGYARYLHLHPEEQQRLISTFLIKVTQFFRDPELFAALRDRVLPELIEQARRRGELRVWSAGCSTGEEAYTLAILVSEALGEDMDRLPVRIFATDLDADAIAFARRGVYPAPALADLPPELVERYFTEDADGAFEVKKQLRGLIVFGQHDLGQRSPFPRIDLTLCRNVLIYFTPDLQRRALQLFAFSLRDGGFLALGKAETASPMPEYFAPENPRLKIYRRAGERVLIPPARLRVASPVPFRPPRDAALVGPLNLALARMRRERPRERTAAELAEGILLRLPVGVVVVDRCHDIRAINNAARQLLGIHREAIGEDLIHLVQTASLLSLRVAIDAAFRGESPTGVYPVDTVETVVGEARSLEITCYAERFEADGGNAETVVVLVNDVTTGMQERRLAERSDTQRQEELAHATEQIRRLTEVNRQLVAANQELTAANADLRSINQEFLVANEEVQAATEEVETLNEELQATNEELETLNEELQATVEELNTSNDDLQSRGLELQQLVLEREEQREVAEAERRQLEAILVAIADAVLVVDADGRPVLINAAYRETFGEGADWIPQDEAGVPLPPDAWPQRRAAGESFTLPFTLPGAHGTRRWYEASGQPVGGEGGVQSGVVVIRDITDRSLRRLQEQFLAMVSHELRTPLTALSGALQMLDRRLAAAEADDRLRQPAVRALEQVRRLDAHIAELMDVARLQSGKLRLQRERLDLATLAARVVDTAEPLTTDQTIRLDAPEEPLPIAGDARRLEQVVLNLLTNAITYAPGTERIDLGLGRADGSAEIRVRDYGPGIPAADLPNIFSRFFQAEHADRPVQDGLGLGLYIAREIVTAHGGTIDVASTVGAGSTFTIRLPLLGE